jgi:secondary thiamine-phosphate synthase enzyme
MQQLTVHSRAQEDLVDITALLNDAIRQWSCLAVIVYVPHTTAGILINEHADPDVARDIGAALDRLVPANGCYRHSEGNSAAHVKATLVGTSQLIPVNDRRLALGTWQGVFLAEFDGPRTRHVVVVPLSGNT